MRDMSETHRPRRMLRRIGAVLAIFILSIVTDMALHAAGIYPPWGETIGDAPPD